jgi:hypothetical protein
MAKNKRSKPAGGKNLKQKDEPQTFIGQQAAEKFTEALSKSGAVLETPLYPFKASYIKFVNLTGKDVGKYGAFHFDKSDKDILKKTVGSRFNLDELRAFLAQKCNVQNPESYSWSSIIAALTKSIEQAQPGSGKADLPAEKRAEPEQKKKGILKKLLKWLVGIIGAIIVSIIADILGHFGWFERIKTIVHNILTNK